MLRKIAEELEKRVINDQIGGWSTNHSEPMKKLAFSIWAQIGRSGSDTDESTLLMAAREFDRFSKEVRSGGWSTQNLEFFERTSNEVYAWVARNNDCY